MAVHLSNGDSLLLDVETSKQVHLITGTKECSHCISNWTLGKLAQSKQIHFDNEKQLPKLSNLPATKLSGGKLQIKPNDVFSVQSFEHSKDGVEVMSFAADNELHFSIYGIFELQPIKVNDVSSIQKCITNSGLGYSVLLSDNKVYKLSMDLKDPKIAELSKKAAEIDALLYYISETISMMQKENSQWQEVKYNQFVNGVKEKLNLNPLEIQETWLEFFLLGKMSTELEAFVFTDNTSKVRITFVFHQKLQRWKESLDIVLHNLEMCTKLYLIPALQRLILLLEDIKSYTTW
jgi:hypothetical protein